MADTRSYDAFLILYNAVNNAVEYPFLTNNSKNSLIAGKQGIIIPGNGKEATYEVHTNKKSHPESGWLSKFLSKAYLMISRKPKALMIARYLSISVLYK